MKYFIKGLITLVLMPIIAIIGIIVYITDSIMLLGGKCDYVLVKKFDEIVEKWMDYEL